MINFRLFLKGAAMGCADLIPGVSGGTIALITGIYEELINSIRSLDGEALKLAVRLRIKALWNHINGTFLLHVLGGILVSIFSLSRLITYLLENEPIPLWSFFFGLILISAFYVMPRKKDLPVILFLMLGALSAYLITTLGASSTPDQLWFVFVAGAIAICAMILPGISGSFILILLAKYEYVLSAVRTFDLKIILTFGLGCVVGLLSFSKLIHWLLQHHRGKTMAALAGFMLGSLNKIWPWKETSDISFTNLTPAQFVETTGQPSQLWLAIVFCITGGALVILLERFGQQAE